MVASKTCGFAVFFATVFLTSSGWATAEEDPHSIPYEAFHALLQYGTPDMNGTDTNRTFAVVSRLPDVSPTDIVFTIRSTNRSYEIHLNENGYPIDFPLTPELLAENPPIFVNQPTGTVSVTARMNFTEPENGPIGTAIVEWVSEIVRNGLRLQNNSVSYQALHHLLGRSPTFRGQSCEDDPAEEKNFQVDLDCVRADPVVLEYKGFEAAGIRYHASNEDVDIPINAEGLVSVPVSDSLWEANPWITFYPGIADWHAHGNKPEFATHSLKEILELAKERYAAPHPEKSGKED